MRVTNANSLASGLILFKHSDFLYNDRTMNDGTVVENEGPSHFERILLERTRTYLIPSAISCLFCLVPGLVAVYYGFQVRAAKQIGDALIAQVASGKARFWMIISYMVGIIALAVQLYRISK